MPQRRPAARLALTSLILSLLLGIAAPAALADSRDRHDQADKQRASQPGGYRQEQQRGRNDRSDKRGGDGGRSDRGDRSQLVSQPRISSREAASRAQSRYGGKVLKVSRSGKGYSVKLLLDSGRVTTVEIEG